MNMLYGKGGEDMEVLRQLLPQNIAEYVRKYVGSTTEEIRLRVDQPVVILSDGKQQRMPCVVTNEDLDHILRCACRQSVYSRADQIRGGYLTIEGGHRIGICGKAVTEKGILQTITDISSLNIRLASQRPTFGSGLAGELHDSTLILGPPGVGKTTLLRTVVRELSDFYGCNVGLVDERGELAACVGGKPQLQVGGNTDVVTGMDKAQSVMHLLRVMTPQWIVVDEITAPRDIAAMETACYSGVFLLATAHAADTTDLRQRPLYRHLMECGIFRNLAILRKDRTYEMERWID